jgi:hypothetical protein
MEKEMKQSNPPNNTSRVTNPEALLDMITVQAHNKAYDLSMGIATQLVVSLIRSGHITTTNEAELLLEGSSNRLAVKLEKDLIALALNEVQATLSKSEAPIPGITPNVPAKA